MYDPCLRVPPLWGTAGTKVSHINEWQVVNPFPFQHSYIISEQKAKARGCPGQGVVTLVQGIMHREAVAPPGKHSASVPAWSRERPNASYITPPPDMVREAMWTVFSRQVDGIGFHGWECLVDDLKYGGRKDASGYGFTNPETMEVIRKTFRDVAIPLGPLFRKMPERAP